MLAHRHSGRVRRVTLGCVLVAGIATMMCATYGLFAHRSPPDYPKMMETVTDDTQFRLYQRQPNGAWDNSTPFPRDEAIALLEAMAKAEPWQPNKGRLFGPLPRHVPPRTQLFLFWGKDVTDVRQRKTSSVGIGVGNVLFDYNNREYQLSTEAKEVLDRMFPTNSRDGSGRVWGKEKGTEPGHH